MKMKTTNMLCVEVLREAQEIIEELDKRETENHWLYKFGSLKHKVKLVMEALEKEKEAE